MHVVLHCCLFPKTLLVLSFCFYAFMIMIQVVVVTFLFLNGARVQKCLKGSLKRLSPVPKKQHIWLNCNTTRDPENMPLTLLFLFTVHWTVGSHPLGGCSLSNLYPISPTKVLTRKLPHIKRNGLGLWRRMQSLSNLWVCLKYDVAPLWDQYKNF